MQQLPPWAAAIQKNDPKLSEYVSAGRELTVVDEALSAKVKTLMMMLCDALLGHESGVQVIADRARGLGASEQEIA